MSTIGAAKRLIQAVLAKCGYQIYRINPLPSTNFPVELDDSKRFSAPTL
jgi:hypothetical protein